MSLRLATQERKLENLSSQSGGAIDGWNSHLSVDRNNTLNPIHSKFGVMFGDIISNCHAARDDRSPFRSDSAVLSFFHHGVLSTHSPPQAMLGWKLRVR